MVIPADCPLFGVDPNQSGNFDYGYPSTGKPEIGVTYGPVQPQSGSVFSPNTLVPGCAAKDDRLDASMARVTGKSFARDRRCGRCLRQITSQSK